MLQSLKSPQSTNTAMLLNSRAQPSVTQSHHSAGARTALPLLTTTLSNSLVLLIAMLELTHVLPLTQLIPQALPARSTLTVSVWSRSPPKAQPAPRLLQVPLLLHSLAKLKAQNAKVRSLS